MPGVGEPPPPAQHAVQRSAHGAPAPVSYVPLPVAAAGRAAGAAAGARSVVAAQGARHGGRRHEETRQGDFRAGVVANAPGSAYVQQGCTKVIATVYGPRQAGERGLHAAEGHLLLDLSFAPFCSRFQSKDEHDKRTLLYGSVLQRALESVVLLENYCKLAFDISVLVLEDDGGVLTAALAAASLALADAQVQMRDLAAGATVHLAPAPGGSGASPVLLLDCDGEEERGLPAGSSVLHLGLCPARGAVCLMHSAGPIPAEPFEQMVVLAKETAERVGAEMRRSLEERVLRRAAKRARRAARADREATAEGAVAAAAAEPAGEGAVEAPSQAALAPHA